MSSSSKRREFLAVAGASAAAGALAGQPSSAGEPRQPSSPGTRGTVLALGAHYDDGAFGIPGILLQAVEKGYRVVELSLIGEYDNWKPVRGRGRALVDGSRKIAADYGIESRFLGFASGTLTVTEESKRVVAEAVAEVKPDVAFMLWPRDQHPDHEAASELSKLALRLGDRLLPDPSAPWRPPRRIYLYDNGPRHTIGFEPNTFVDVRGAYLALARRGAHFRCASSTESLSVFPTVCNASTAASKRLYAWGRSTSHCGHSCQRSSELWQYGVLPPCRGNVGRRSDSPRVWWSLSDCGPSPAATP